MMNKELFTGMILAGLTGAKKGDLIKPLIDKQMEMNNMDALIEMYAYNVSCFRCPFCFACKVTDSTAKNCHKYLLKQYDVCKTESEDK